ncbi:hypothetical protein CYY_000921 [Polysphondylium violaceum]|uniref:Class VII unconventional myosin n=1 Tax=Polysphondylium violaceum TaxID=133409 RepID=A0A8J4Q311_9MYCE|nr:hypothetical protein CYY_000921 [Polysphondylium violaceum]
MDAFLEEKSQYFQPVEDMITLSELTEESLLLNLKMRYEKKLIYTYTGSILVAVNPYEILPIYTADIVKQYFAKPRGSLPPHIFAVADAAYTNMIEDRKNQSIIISGESGAGKTESTKLIIQYLAARTNRHSQVEQMIVESSPILEAFGNAKTIRNNNSSRFGKFIEIQFNTSGHISGARIINYLLEKSRISHQASSERNYHIFYQLLAGATPEMKEKLHLTEPEDYHYLNQSGCIRINNINDVEDFEHVRYAMNVLTLPEDKQNTIFSILSAVLHLGNIQFEKSEKTQGAEGSSVTNQDTLQIVAKLLQVDSTKLETCLTIRHVLIRGQKFVIPLKVNEAEDTRDSLAKSLYGNVFNWLVAFINTRIYKPQPNSTFIGVLDIFGFENFKKNSFEQFCINFANEKLQQHFNQHIFKLEQEEYEKEKINWSKIVYNDNQECLDLIEKRPLGILSLLDEESKFPQATDLTFLEKLHINHEKHPYYEKPRRSKTTYVVKHYAGEVAYDTQGFLDKNKDTVSDDLLGLLQGAKNKFIVELFSAPKGEDDDDDGKATIKKKTTAGGEFKTQLQQLINILSATAPHYVRCIKPNTTKEPCVFDHELIQAQLRYAGMMETIRIRKLGYPIRFSHKEFRDRYLLLDFRARSTDHRQTSIGLINLLNSWKGIEKDEWQTGISKVFIRDPQYRLLEEFRKEKLVHKVTLIQSTFRMYRHKKVYLQLRKVARVLQTSIRGHNDRKEFYQIRCAADRIKGFFKMLRAQRDFRTIKRNFSFIQDCSRAFLARKHTRNEILLKKDRAKRMAEIEREKDEQERKKKEKEERERQEKEDALRVAEEKKKILDEQKKKEDEAKAKREEEERKKLEEKRLQLKELNQFEDLASLEKMLKEQHAKNVNEFDNLVDTLEGFSFEGGVGDSQAYTYNNKMYEMSSENLEKISITDLLQGLKQTIRTVTKFDVDESKFDLPPGIENILKRAPAPTPKKQPLPNSPSSSSLASSPIVSGLPSDLPPPPAFGGENTYDGSFQTNLPPPPPSSGDHDNFDFVPPPISLPSGGLGLDAFLPPPVEGNNGSFLPPPPEFDFSLPPVDFGADPILGTPPPPPSDGGASSPMQAATANPTPAIKDEVPLAEILQDEELTLYNFYEYANKNFNVEKLKQKEDIFGYQKSHIKSSLLIHTDSENTKLGVEIFSKVLSYMTQHPLSSKKDPSDFFAPVKFILTKGMAIESLRDEIYCQLIKQSTNNPNQDLNTRVWELIHYCCATFSPSRKLTKYFAAYVKTTIKTEETAKSIIDSAQSSYRILQRFNLNGTRKYVPSIAELESIKENRPIFIRVTASDASLKGINIDSATTCVEASNDLSVRCRMRPNTKDNGFSIMEYFSGIERDIGANDKVCDVLAKVENLQAAMSSKMNINFKFIFKKRLFLDQTHIRDETTDSHILIEKDFYFHQLYNELFTFEKNTEFVIKMGALRLQSDSMDYTDEIRNWLPGNARGKYFTMDIEKNKFEEFITQYKSLKGLSQMEARKKLYDMVFGHALCGHSLFQCEHQLQESIYPKSFVLALNLHGMHIYDQTTSKMLGEPIKYANQPTNIKFSEKSVTLLLENKSQFEVLNSDVNKLLATIKEYSFFLKNHAKFARALRDYNVSDPSLLNFKRGEIISILFKDQENKWYIGTLNGREGSFPVDHVEILLGDTAPPSIVVSSLPTSPSSPLSGPSTPPVDSAAAFNIPPPVSLSTSPSAPPPPMLNTPAPPMLNTPTTPPPFRASIRQSIAMDSPAVGGGSEDDPSKRLSVSPAIGSDSPLIQWAQTRFRSYKKAAAATLKRKTAIDPNIIFYFTKDPIKESLIELTDTKLAKKAVKNFSEIMMYMGEYPLPKGKMASHIAQSIISRGLTNPEIRDEIYCQAYRQTNKNPKADSAKKGFELLYFMAVAFPPSESLVQPFNEQLMSRCIGLQSSSPAIATAIQGVLEKLEQHPLPGHQQRKQGPSTQEIQSLRNPDEISAVKVRFIDPHTTKLTKISTFTMVKEITEQVCKQYGINHNNIKLFGLYQVNETANICKNICESDLIYDTLAKWEQSEEKGEFYLQVRRRYFLDDVSKILNQEHLWTDDEVCFDLTYLQVRDEWTKGLYSSLSEKDVATGAALLIQLSHPNQSKLQFNKELLRQCMPEANFSSQNIKFWTALIESQIFELVSHTAEYLKLLFIQLIGSKCPTFGCTLFHVQQKENPPKALLGISKKGVNVFDPHTKESKNFWTFQSISNWTFTDDSFVLMTGNLMKPIKNTFTTDEYAAISSIYQFYSS